jgi:hypothetical protein
VIFFYVVRDGDTLEEPFASRVGAESFIKICKRIDKKAKRVYIYSIEEVEFNPFITKENQNG